jgi:hypothetical protein
MKTDDLISFLATGATAVPTDTARRSFFLALGCGALGAFFVMVILFGIRRDLLQAMSEWLFWLKLVFAGSLALSGGISTNRLGRPGARLERIWIALVTPVIVVWIASSVMLFMADPVQRSELILGTTWKSCPFNIALISLPLLMAMFWAMRQLAPTHLRRAGASAGLLAGSLGTMVYALHCPESAIPFVGIWYVLGIAISTLVGALLGPRILKW